MGKKWRRHIKAELVKYSKDNWNKTKQKKTKKEKREMKNERRVIKRHAEEDGSGSNTWING